MQNLLLGTTATLFYVLGTIIQMQAFRGKLKAAPQAAPGLGIIAGIFHALLTWNQVHLEEGMNFGLMPSILLIALLTAAGSAVLTLLVPRTQQQKAGHLILVTYPFAILTLFALSHPQHGGAATPPPQAGVFAHIMLSMTAYSLLTISAVIAMAYHFQNKHLRAHNTSTLIKALPPLMTVEMLLFATVRAGWALLTIAIIMGLWFTDDIVAQHLAHKTAFSILAWILFGTLLAGHHFKGWRAATASRWTLWGCFFLMLGFIGSKVVLALLANP